MNAAVHVAISFLCCTHSSTQYEIVNVVWAAAHLPASHSVFFYCTFTRRTLVLVAMMTTDPLHKSEHTNGNGMKCEREQSGNGEEERERKKKKWQ